jgi:hypothetical protein
MSDSSVTDSDQNSAGRPPENSGTSDTPPPGQSQSVTHHQEPEWAKNLAARFDALPESLAKSIKEAVGTPKAPVATPPENKQENKEESSAVKETTKHAEPGTNKSGSAKVSDRFNKWWFGQ